MYVDWIAALKGLGGLALSFGYFILNTCYYTLAPARWLVYSIYSMLLFILSPIFYILSIPIAVLSFIVDMIVRLKYIYVYLACATIIGLISALVLHRTSNIIFILFGIDGSPQALHSRGDPQDSDDDNSIPPALTDFSSDTSTKLGTSTSGLGTGPSSISSISAKRRARRDDSGINTNDLFEKRWKQLRSPQTRRKHKVGPLARSAIHEESSESDFS
ncbi:hypothetical protein F5Y18DRAFT_402569 [Xylariaceae sp. FL1019]|nr:hypothetical protein F5Y18DRAFT_402569 [Xylariaceae sp. FL1019]